PWPVVSGTNKVVACTGTTVAAGQFVRSKVLPWREMVGPVISSMAGASLGVAMAYYLSGRFEPYMRPAMVIVMLAMLAWTLAKPDAGSLHAPKLGLGLQRSMAITIAFALGFYDGLFGPGTGSILIFLFVAVLGFDFLRSSALAKSINWASNFTAVVLFLSQGSWVPVVALTMAAGNGLGGYLGARTALSKGNSWVRVVFIVVVSALILRLGWQIWKG
ncbi:MAG TPA: TSUP family transporter, partial [Holophaga sp.]|nr:TSUP family transporter [Holophaga sp.]